MRSIAAALLLAVVCQSAARAQTPPLETVLLRAAEYVAAYQKGLRGIVAEETYQQNLTSTRAGGIGGRGRMNREGRQLKSDLLLVKLPSEERWLQFRDVFEVDRKPVRDRDERLYKLFVDARPEAQRQAEAIQAESSRYNLGPIMRTINIPMLALYIFDRNIHSGVVYNFGEAGNVKRFADLAPAESISLVEFRETTRDTLVKGDKGREVPSRGRAWIDITSGRVLQTELICQDIAIRAQITVTYQQQPGIAVLVPQEMREVYTLVQNDTRIDGRARYGRFRQFTVTTTEKPKQ